MVSRESGGGFVQAGFLVRLGLYAAMGMVLVLWVAPLLWMLSTSLKPEGQILSLVPRWIPKTFTLGNYRDVLEKYRLVAWGVNSMVVAAGATILGLIVSIPAAYAFAKMRFRGQQWIFLLILSTILVPVHITIVPLFLGLATLRLTDTYFSLIMPTVANGFGVFLLRQFFQGIRRSWKRRPSSTGPAGSACWCAWCCPVPPPSWRRRSSCSSCPGTTSCGH
jgi:ABC-type glycerol-3-phosphate transport system permease component